MKFKKRMISLLLAILLVFNSIPVDSSSVSAEVTVKENLKDFIADVEYGWTGGTYRFSDGVLDGVAAEDDVYLTATATVDGVDGIPDAGDITVVFTEFKILGDDAQYYVIPDLTGMTVSKTIKVLPKTLKIRPAMTEAYYGQDLPENGRVSVSEDYKKQLVSGGDNVTVSCFFTFKLDGATQVGTYELEEVGEIQVKGKGRDNYEAVVENEENLVFSILPYTTEAVASDGNDADNIGNQNGKTEATLSAPPGFQISSEGNLGEEGWAGSIVVDLEETDGVSTKEIVYYLRNNERGSEFYRAICEKTYKYSAMPLPTVTGIEILPVVREETVDGVTNTISTKLLSEENGVFANGDVQVAVYVTGASFEQETTITLVVDGVETTKPAAEVVPVDGKYTYKALFDIASVDGDSVPHVLQAYANNSSGTGAVYPAADCRDTYLNSQTPVTERLVLDRKAPDVTIVSIETIRKNNGFYEYPEKLVGTFTVDDIHSGVVKVEYKWDAREYQEYRDLDKSSHQVELFWYEVLESPVSDGIHTLYLRVTDALGNVTEVSLKQQQSDDTEPPVIDSILIEGIKDTANGLLANSAVKITIEAHDFNGDASVGVSNVQKVLVIGSVPGRNGQSDAYAAEAKWDEAAGAYILTIQPNKQIFNMKVQVWDKFGYTEKALNLIPMRQTEPAEGETANTEPSYYQSANLYIEKELPSISFQDAENLGQEYGDDNYWYGMDKAEASLVIQVKDEGITAGLKKITVTESVKADDGTETTKSWSSEPGFAANSGSVSISLKEFGEGKHTIHVTAEDYCGNSHTKSFTFTKDTKVPQTADIVPDKNKIKTIENEIWFSPNGEGDHLTFTIGTTAKDDTLSRIEITVNDGERTYAYDQGKYQIKHRENGSSYIELSTKDFVLNTPEDSYNQYVVTAVFVDLAGNPTEKQIKTVYVDREDPEIRRITVQKKDETLLQQIIRILSFGIFSNDTLIFRVYPADAPGDSGVAGVVMKYSAEAEEIRLESDGDAGHYYIEVSENDITKLGATLSFKVTDRYGKTCEHLPIIQNANDENDSTNNYFVMVESVLPTISFNLAEGSGIGADGRRWYNGAEENKREDGLLYKEMKLTVQDVDSGIYAVVVDVNGVKSVLYSNPTERDNDSFVRTFNAYHSIQDESQILKDGTYHIAIKVVDNAGNTETLEDVYYIDTVKPKIDKISFSVPTADGIRETAGIFADPKGISYGYFFKENFDITVHVSDAAPSSGLYHVRYWLNSQDGEPVEVEVVDGKASVDVPDNFKGRIFYEVLDNAGNSSGVLTTDAYVVDKAAPTIQITNHKTTSYRDANNNPLYTEANSFTVVITDTVSGLQELSYTKSAELHAEEKKTIKIGDNGQTLGDGWEITGREANLVTQVKKTFTFADNDNDICMHFNAMDRSRNVSATVDSETFTIDTIAPVIVVDFGSDNDDDPYYNQNRVATIRVTERNFRADLIKVMIENYFGSVPGYSFTAVAGSNTEYVATINFDEGDYTFDLTGKDLCDHSAVVTFTGGNEKLFYVDKTVPMIVENFWEFANERENSFNVDKTAQIKIVEHNFDAGLTNLRITRKAAGNEHSHNGMVDVTNEVLGGRGWTKNGDAYYIEFTFSTDAVYYVELAPVDLASNQGAKHNTVIFEIDKTVPVVSAKNGEAVGPDDTELLDVYPYDRRESAAPTVEFTDNNIACIEYTLITYIPEYLSDGLVQVKPVIERGTVEGSLFTLENFDRDGIYAVELVAVDVAGNRSEVNSNTYARMVNQDVLAFILDSNVKEQTGLFSLEYEDGEAISKKPYDFKDLRILVMTPVETPIDIVLRDTNGKEIMAAADLTSVESVYGVNVHIFEIGADFFRENFQDDIDTEMHLTVWNQGYRIDLARIHIDNIAPDCDFPQELRRWAWFAGEEDRTFTISNISELLELEDCKVYDNGVEIPFEYSSEDDTLSFTLSKGWHNIGVILCDAAGNANISQEMNNIHIGNFWTIFGVTAGSVIVIGLIMAFLYKRKRTVQEMLEEA